MGSGGSVSSSVGLIFGCMKSGKSARLLEWAHQTTLRGKRVVAMKSKWDSRDGACIKSRHPGTQAYPAHFLSSDLSDFREHFDNPVADCYLVDEAFMFGPEILNFIDAMRSKGVSVILSGLDLNFRGEHISLGGSSTHTMKDLFEKVDWLERLFAYCDVCGSPATRSQRLHLDGSVPSYNEPELVVGDFSYQARCLDCFSKPVC